jgi:hypothetical protein
METFHQSVSGNIVDRLKIALHRAKQIGYAVRMEPLGGRGTTWCEINGRVYLFVDLSQSASEQLTDVESILSDGPGAYRNSEVHRDTPRSIAA